ncbi:MAG: NHL repeat-containing protein [Candidatus Goldiibacteriota bacterium]
MISRQELVISIVLFFCIIILIFNKFSTENVRGDNRKQTPQNVDAAQDGAFLTPRDIAVDTKGDGSVYVVDSKNNRIQKFGPDGRFILAWGSEGNGPGQFKDPCGIDLGPGGSIYVSDTWNSRVQVFTATGRFIMEFGRETGMWGPRDLVAAKSGNIFVADTGNGKIEKFSKDGEHLMTIGTKGSGELEFMEPFGMVQGPDGYIYILDRLNFRVQKITEEGGYAGEFKVDGWDKGQIVNGCLMEPYASVSPDGKYIYITDSSEGQIIRYDLDGKNKKVFAEDENGEDLFVCPIGVAAGTNGKIYVTDAGAGRLVSFTDK